MPLSMLMQTGRLPGTTDLNNLSNLYGQNTSTGQTSAGGKFNSSMDAFSRTNGQGMNLNPGFGPLNSAGGTTRAPGGPLPSANNPSGTAAVPRYMGGGTTRRVQQTQQQAMTSSPMQHVNAQNSLANTSRTNVMGMQPTASRVATNNAPTTGLLSQPGLSELTGTQGTGGLGHLGVYNSQTRNLGLSGLSQVSELSLLCRPCYLRMTRNFSYH